MKMDRDTIVAAQVVYAAPPVGLIMRQMVREVRWRWAETCRRPFIGTIKAYTKRLDEAGVLL